MICENVFCIYQFNGKCHAETINIDRLGMCTECIYPDIDENILNDAKLALLKKYENRAIRNE